MAQTKIYELREHLALLRGRLSDSIHACVVVVVVAAFASVS